MKKIEINLPETEEEIKEAINHIRKIDKVKIKPLIFIPSCENCAEEGGSFWHCHNPRAPKCYINVNRYDVCSHYVPNWGLMTYLWYRAWLEKSEQDRNKDIKFMKEFEPKK